MTTVLETPLAAARTPRPLYWSVRRELWENRSVFIAPLAAAGVLLFGFLIGAVYLPRNVRLAMATIPASHAGKLAEPFDFAAAAIIFTSMIVAAFYCLGALHGERRDRSILFWKSLPVSDLTTVISKALIPLVILPLIAFAIIAATQLVMLLISTVVLASQGLSAAELWVQVASPGSWLTLIYGLTVISLWYAPIWGWLLLISGWAKRATFLWAVLPPLALCVVETIAFQTSHFASLLVYRLGGFGDAFNFQNHNAAGSSFLAQIDAARILGTPGLWLGLIFAAALLAAAVWQRRHREPL